MYSSSRSHRQCNPESVSGPRHQRPLQLLPADCALLSFLRFLLRLTRSDSTVEEAVASVFLLKNEDEGDFIDSIVFQHVLVSRCDDLFSLVDADDFECVIQIGHRDLLDLEHVIGVKNRLEVLCRQELRLELIERVVVRVLLAELLALDRLEHFEDGSLGVRRLLI